MDINASVTQVFDAAGSIHMWDLVSKKSCGRLEGHKGVVTSVCGVPKSQQLLTAGADCEVKLWDF